MSKGKVTIVGCGLIGSCWGALFASAGYDVCVYEINDEFVSQGIQRIKDNLSKLESDGLSRGLPESEAIKNIRGTSDMKEALRDSIYAQESTVETEEFKQKIFKEMDELSEEGTILASSTSTIPASKFTKDLTGRGRCLVVHPVNPPLYLSLTEVVPAPWTTPAIVDRACDILKDIGQSPVRLHKEVLGFAVNRVQYSVLAECWRLVKDGVIDPGDIDLVMSEGLGPRYAFYGPLQVIHMNANGVSDYCARYAAGIRRVLEDMGPNPSFQEPEVIKKIEDSMNDRIPDLSAAIKERQQNLARLAKLKKD